MIFRKKEMFLVSSIPIGLPLTGSGVALELIVSCDWNWDGGARIVPK